MENFILSVLAGLVTSYITYLCSKIKNHLFNGRRKSGYEFELKFKLNILCNRRYHFKLNLFQTG